MTTEQDADFLPLAQALFAGADADGEQRASAKRHIADSLAVIGAGYRHQAVLDLLGSGVVSRSGGSSPFLGTDEEGRPSDAILVNAYAGHLDDYDDDEAQVSLAHCSIPCLASAVSAAALSWSKGDDVSSERVIDAFRFGTTTMVALGIVMNPRHYLNGWHASATLGSMGAAATACFLLGMDPRTTATAMSLASTRSAGPRSSFGSDAKPLQVAMAARDGFEAALLARSGMSSGARLAGEMSFVSLHGGAPERLGEACKWASQARVFKSPGVTIKCFPCCTATHPGIDAAASLRADGLDLDDIARIRIFVGRTVPGILIHAQPVTPAQGRFSIEYCVASSLVAPVGLSTFEETSLQNQIVRRLMQRTEVIAVPEQDDLFLTRIELEMGSGALLERSVSAAPGSPARPLSDARLAMKIEDCLTRPDAAAALLGQWRPSWNETIDLFRPHLQTSRQHEQIQPSMNKYSKDRIAGDGG